MKEIWKDVVGFEGRYMVSNLGNVKSCRYFGHEGEHLMKLSKHHSGYLVVTLGKRPERKQPTVHSLVAKAFIPNPHNLPAINHIDGDKANNNVTNLEWVTYKENTAHAINAGLFDPVTSPKRIGKDHSFSRPVLQYGLDGKFIKLWDCQSDAARTLLCEPCSISGAVDRPNKTCIGYMWRSYEPGSPIQKQIAPTNSRLAQRPIMQCHTDGSLIKVWTGLREIDKESPFDRHAVSDCLKGKRESYKGYLWRY